MKTTKKVKLCTTLLAVVVLYAACTSGNSNEKALQTKVKHSQLSGKNQMQRVIDDRDRLTSLDSVIIGNFTGKGVDTLYVAKHSDPKPFYISYHYQSYALEDEDGNKILEDGDKFLIDGGDVVYNKDSIIRNGRTEIAKLENCSILSKSGTLPELSFKDVYGRGLFLEGDLDGNGTDEFGYFTLKHRYPLELKGYFGYQREYVADFWEEYELCNYVYRIITYVDGQWKCMATIDDEYDDNDELMVHPLDNSRIMVIHKSFEKYNSGALEYYDTSFVKISYKKF